MAAVARPSQGFEGWKLHKVQQSLGGLKGSASREDSKEPGGRELKWPGGPYDYLRVPWLPWPPGLPPGSFVGSSELRPISLSRNDFFHGSLLKTSIHLGPRQQPLSYLEGDLSERRLNLRALEGLRAEAYLEAYLKGNLSQQAECRSLQPPRAFNRPPVSRCSRQHIPSRYGQACWFAPYRS